MSKSKLINHGAWTTNVCKDENQYIRKSDEMWILILKQIQFLP